MLFSRHADTCVATKRRSFIDPSGVLVASDPIHGLYVRIIVKFLDEFTFKLGLEVVEQRILSSSIDSLKIWGSCQL